MLLAASFVLLTLGASADRVRAGVSYVMVSMVSSLIFLAGIAFAYAATGTLNLADMATRLDGIPSGTRTAIFGVLLVAFGIKAAVFPLSTWLPDSYPTAPAPVTAVFAGLLTKVGVYAIIRAHTLLFPEGELDNVLMVCGLLTMLVGILGAIAQSDIKRLLSFTLVSHIGYMVFGVALSTQSGLSGAIYYVAHHILVQTTLFLVVGLIERQAGSSSLRRLGGLAAASPVLAIVFLVPALNLGGIPPFSGSSARSRCCRPARRMRACWRGSSSRAEPSPASSRCTSSHVCGPRRSGGRAPTPPRVTSRTSARRAARRVRGRHLVRRPRRRGPYPRDDAHPHRRPRRRRLAMTVFAGQIIQISDRAASDLQNRSIYIDAVLGGHPDGEAQEAPR